MQCRACHGSTEAVFEMEPMPLAGAFAKTQEEALAAHKYPLSWHWCGTCGLVNVEPEIDPDLIFADYSYVTGDVPGLVRHHTEYAQVLSRLPVKRVLEIGGNDGTLLRRLPSAWQKVNVDPSDVAKTHQGDYELINEPFSSALGLRGFDLITASNSMAHFPGISDALDAAREALKPAGEFWVEVHDLRATFISGQWDTVYHEHLAEWSEDALRNAGAIHGLKMTGLSRTHLHGGSLRARFVRGKGQYRPPKKPGFDLLQNIYDNRRRPDLPEGSVAYGAAARGTVYLNQVRPHVEYVVDSSPRRYGRFVPGTGTPIHHPDTFDADPPPAALITAWNHARDIKARHPLYKGKWVSAW
jgi:hypothetical protein